MGIGIMVKPPKYFREYIKYSGSQASLRKSGDKRESRIKSSLLKVLKGGYYLKNLRIGVTVFPLYLSTFSLEVA